MRELKLWISRKLFGFLSDQRPKGVGGELFIVLISKRAVGELFTGQVWWTSLEVGHRSDLSGGVL
jgi:hypothetical protein